MEFESSNARMSYETDLRTVFFEGTFRLNAEEYAIMFDNLKEILAKNVPSLKLDLTGMEFLNSSGINVIAKFVIAARSNPVALTIRGNKDIPWQGKSLPNLKKIHPGLELIID